MKGGGGHAYSMGLRKLCGGGGGGEYVTMVNVDRAFEAERLGRCRMSILRHLHVMQVFSQF